MARQPIPKALSSLQSVQRSYTSEFSVGELLLSERVELSELSWYPKKEEGNLQFGSNQDSVDKGCQKSGCGGYGDCRVVVI
jgi:hypothetical protein